MRASLITGWLLLGYFIHEMRPVIVPTYRVVVRIK